MPRKPSAHAELDRLEQRVAQARMAAREAEVSEAASLAAVKHGEGMLAAHARWGALSQKVAGYLLAMHLNPAENSRGEHELAPIVRDMKRALAGDISSPAPHWSARRFAEAEQARRASLLDEREEAAA